MDKYEISLWEDYPDTTSDGTPFLNERKLCIIGSDTMQTLARAVEPCLVSNVNGTHIFTFKLYYRFKDEITGEDIINPFLPYIINERKVKVFWKDIWYDLVIKKIEEDSQGRYITCSCEDLFITELSKNGYELEFNSELQNNSGTAAELAEKVLDGSGWQLSSNPISIIQYHEEAVYEVNTQRAFSAIKQSPNGDTTVTIPSGKLCLLYQSQLDEDNTEIQFLYAANGYSTDVNDMVVTNGNCYKITGVIVQNGNQASVYKTNGNTQELVFQFNVNDSFSSRYRAKRLVNSQLTVFDDLLGRYVDVYNNGNVYGYETTEYSDPTLVINLLANTSNFKDTKGWIGSDLTWQVYPPFTNQSQVATYAAKSYLQIKSGYTYNTAFVSNKKYLTPNSIDIKNGVLGGFQIGEQYIFRYKAKSSLANSSYITSGITGNVYRFNNTTYAPTEVNNSYFRIINGPTGGGSNWVEYTLECQRACTANELEQIGFFINSNATYWIEDIQFFKLSYGLTTYDSSVQQRIEPGMIALQSIAKVVYRYYNADHDGVEDAKDLKFLYQGETKSNTYTPVYNNYEKITSIEESKSNRFNILQSIAEKFECWIRFDINHDATGKVLYDNNGLPQKYVSLVEQIGYDTGISFEYGIDLKGIKRTIVSNTIATKAIIIPNENQFGQNGFCTIARSQLNYPRENFIINFDYYINQGLLDKNTVEADLYKTNGRNLGYYYYLNRYNREYDELAYAINIKRTELIKQQAELKVQTGNLRAALEKLDNSKSDVMFLANVTTWTAAQTYAQTHANNNKVQSLMGSIAQLNNEISNLNNSIPALENSISVLENYINTKAARMAQLIELTSNLHKAFFKKYSRYLQEGTWQDQNYVDDDKYYLDGLEVAYRSSRPQIQYDISLIRVSGLEDFSSKVFDTGDICYIQDREFFGYQDDKITPYKQKVTISQLTSYFDSPEKDIIKVQNYKTQFDDLFQRITTTTQSLQYAQGSYERAAGVVKPDGTLSFGLLQDTFDYNKDLVIGSANQDVVWDNTGITISDKANTALKVRIIAGGIFVSNDGGETWKNAVRGDGISTDLLTAGRINTSEIFVYDGNHQSFRWDSQGINAYFSNTNNVTDFGKFVRFDRFGLYGYQGNSDFVPSTEDAIWDTNNNVKFGLTWKGFFLRGSNGSSQLDISDDGNGITFLMKNSIGNNSLEISTTNDIILKNGNVNRIQIGRLNPNSSSTEYGIWIRDNNGQNIFNVSSNGTNSIGGWNLTKDSFYHTTGNNTIGLYSSGTSATVQGVTDTFHILAGNKFGVTVDGKVYASAGKIGGWTINTGSLTGGNIVIDASGTLSCTLPNASVPLRWKLDSNGKILALEGEIAGWVFTPTGIYNTHNGTFLNSGWDGNYNVNKYTIDTDSLRASIGSIGGWSMTPAGFTSSNGVSLGSGGILNLGANGQLIAGDVVISKDSITFDDNLTIGGFYQNWASDRDKLINDAGITLDREEGIINIGTVNTRSINTSNDLATTKAVLKNNAGIDIDAPAGRVSIYSTATLASDAKDTADQAVASIDLLTDVVDGHTTSIVNINSDITNINSDIVNIQGKLIVDSISGNTAYLSKNVASTTFYGTNFIISSSGTTETNLSTHRHNIIEGSGGGLILTGPIPLSSVVPFNIADTKFYKDGVSAVVLSTLTTTNYDSGDSVLSALQSDSTKTVRSGKNIFATFITGLTNNNTKKIRTGINAESVYNYGTSQRTATSVAYEKDDNDNYIWDKIQVKSSDNNVVSLSISPNAYTTGKNAGALTAIVRSVTLGDPGTMYSSTSGGVTRWYIPITATGYARATKGDGSYYDPTTGQSFSKTIDVTTAYSTAYSSGQTAGVNSVTVPNANIVLTTSGSSPLGSNATITATATASNGSKGTNSANVVLALGNLSYDSSTHKYTTVSSISFVRGTSTTKVAELSKTSGTEAYNAGKTDGQNDAKPNSISRRINQSTGSVMSDTWNSSTNKGQIYLRAGSSNSSIYYDATIEVDTNSAIYKAAKTDGANTIDITAPTTTIKTAHISPTSNDNHHYVGIEITGNARATKGDGTYVTNSEVFNVRITADTVYSDGINDAKANYITYTPSSASSWNSLVAQSGSIKTSGNYKYIQPQFNLTAGHQISGSTSTSYNYTSNNSTFNVDVTSVINSVTILNTDVVITAAKKSTSAQTAVITATATASNSNTGTNSREYLLTNSLQYDSQNKKYKAIARLIDYSTSQSGVEIAVKTEELDGSDIDINSLSTTPIKDTNGTIQYAVDSKSLIVPAKSQIKQNGTVLKTSDSVNLAYDATLAYNAGWDYGATTAQVNSVSLTSSDNHKTAGSHHYVTVKIDGTAKGTKSDGSTYTSASQTVASTRDVIADAVYIAGAMDGAESTIKTVRRGAFITSPNYTVSINSPVYGQDGYLKGGLDIIMDDGNNTTLRINVTMNPENAYNAGYDDGYEQGLQEGADVDSIEYLSESAGVGVLRLTPKVLDSGSHVLKIGSNILANVGFRYNDSTGKYDLWVNATYEDSGFVIGESSWNGAITASSSTWDGFRKIAWIGQGTDDTGRYIQLALTWKGTVYYRSLYLYDTLGPWINSAEYAYRDDNWWS